MVDFGRRHFRDMARRESGAMRKAIYIGVNCRAENCERGAKVRGLCLKHYHKSRYDDKRKERPPRPIRTLEQRQRVKADNFEKKYGPGSFRQLTDMLSQPCYTLRFIGEKYGVTRERIRQLYNCFFPYQAREKRGRRKICTIGKRKKRTRFTNATLTTWRAARRAGFSVELVPTLVRYFNSMIKINGYLVRCHEASNEFKTLHGSRIYAHTHFRGDCDFNILLVRGNLFVIPHSRKQDIYIPLNESLRPNYHSKKQTDWFQYKDAWHQLAEPKLEVRREVAL